MRYYWYIYIIYTHTYIYTYAQPPKLEKELGTFGWKAGKNSKSQKVKSQKVYFSTFRLFFFPLTFSTFRLFFFPLDSQRFKFCTFSCACSAGEASGKNSNSQCEKSKSILFDISTFRSAKRNLSTFRLFIFRLFEIDFAYFPPGALQHIFPTQNPTPFHHFNA